MKILLFGKNGQVGWELNRSLLPLGDVIAYGREDADFSKPESLRKIVQNVRPDVIINAVAYTAVDKAEEEEDLALVINGEAPKILAEETLKINALLVHYSTDYVFDGTKNTPYVETDEPNPINAYGRTKLSGEVAIQLTGCNYLIFRISWVYAARGNNFLKTMLRLMQEREELCIVADQYGTPTWARNIADATAHALFMTQRERKADGFLSSIHHLSASGKTTWYGFSEAIIDQIKQIAPLGHLKTERVLPIPTEDYPLPAPRPKNSQLDSNSLTTRFAVILPEWHDAMKLCIAEVLKP